MKTKHPWHDLKPGELYPEIVNTFIEISKNSRAKYELDKDSGLLRLDRVIYSSMYYPANYGFIPKTLSDDGDPLDILVLSQINIEPRCIVRGKVIGAFKMLDEGKGDDKIIAVAADDISVNHINDVSELPPHFIKEIKNFFEEYKRLENKTVVVDDLINREEAVEMVRRDHENYIKVFSKD